MPQISCGKNIKKSNKTRNEELVKNNKNIQPRDTSATRHVRDTRWTSKADNQLTPSQATTKNKRMQ
jgi:hypothetical protein